MSAPSSPHAEATTRNDTGRLRRWIAVAGGLLVALIVALDGYEAWQDYRGVMEQSTHLADAQFKPALLESWKHQEISSAARTLTLTALVGFLMAGLLNALRRHDRVEMERRRLERELKESQKAEALGMLAASMAHDFNNVLCAIVGHGEIARTLVDDHSRAAASLDHLLSASERARQLVQRVLAFDLQHTAAYAPAAVEPGRGQSILIVDDQLELVQLVEEMVASLGYEAIGFSDARIALDAFERNPARFDAVITDERMPTLRGTALAAAIHKLRAAVPIVLVTGCREAATDALAAQAGIAAILEKPLRAKTLQAVLERALVSVSVAT